MTPVLFLPQPLVHSISICILDIVSYSCPEQQTPTSPQSQSLEQIKKTAKKKTKKHIVNKGSDVEVAALSIVWSHCC